MNDLRKILKEAVAEKGAITFARFMELALYCPNFGYYEQPDVSPGRKGDFFTSVSVGPLFGELLARQFCEWQEKNAGHGAWDQEWQIVEGGAHDGRLAADILGWLRAQRPEIFATVEYWIIEPSLRRKATQENTLAEFSGHLRWFDAWNALPQDGIHGVIFSNELLDAMPVHRIGWDAGRKQWFEWGVKVSDDTFKWAKLDLEGTILNSTLRILHSALHEVLPDGFTIEICPAAIDWWRNAARALKSGKLMTLDYGLTEEQLFTPERSEGTLRAYHKHHQSSDLLACPGEQDLTAQVNFTAIRSAGEAEGLKTEAFTTQGQFLTDILKRNLPHDESLKNWTSAQIRQFQTLTHPEHLGRLFKVLVQSK